jgi:hypothetical protein
MEAAAARRTTAARRSAVKQTFLLQSDRCSALPGGAY